MEHERIPPKSPNSNAHIKAFHRLLEDDCFQRFEFQTHEEAYREVTAYIAFYNERPLHGSIRDLPPKGLSRTTEGRAKAILDKRSPWATLSGDKRR